MVTLDGADNVTIDGGVNKNLIFINGGTTKPAAIWLKSDNVALKGCDNISILNCQVSTGASITSESYGIILSGYASATPVPTYTLAAYDCDNVLIENNKVTKCQYGISATGISASLCDNLIIRKNEIGSDVATTSIGKYGIYISNMDSIVVNNNKVYNVKSTTDAYGIYLTNTKSFKVLNNNINSVTSTATATLTGIYGIFNSLSANTATIKGIIANNVINEVKYTGTSAVNILAYGIYSLTSPYLDITNNAISGVIGSGYGSTSSAISAPTIGICLDGATTTNVNVLYNTVNLYGAYPKATATTYKCMSAGLGLLNAGITGAFNNNVFVDSITSTTAVNYSTKAYGVWAAAGFGFNSTTKYLNYNDYYVKGTFPFVGGIGTTDSALTYTAWKLIATSDLNSKEVLPKFNTPTNLIALPGSGLGASGTPISWLTTDILGVTRGATPTLGAYETLTETVPPSVTFTKLGSTVSLISRSIPAVLTDNLTGVDTTLNAPRVYFKKKNDANTLAGWKFTTMTGYTNSASFLIDYAQLGTVVAGDTIQYFIIAQDYNSPVANISISSGTPAVAPASVALGASAFPINGVIDNYAVIDGISGVYTIGATGNFPNLTGANGAFNALNTKLIAGDVTFKIISDITEPGTVAFQTEVMATGTEKIFIVPDSAKLRTLSGIKDSVGLFRFINVKNVYIDGSIAGSGRYLKFVGSSSLSASIKGATIQLANTAGATVAGCKYISIKNSIINGPDYGNSTTPAERFAIYAGDLALNTTTSVTMADHDSITIVNNEIYHGYYMIYSSGGAAARSNDNWIIKDNLFAGAANASETNSATAIYSYYANNSTIEANTISGLNTSDAVQSIYANSCSAMNINNNKISNLTSSAAVYAVNCSTCVNLNINFNRISNITATTGAYAVNLLVCSTAVVTYNNINTVKGTTIYGIYNTTGGANPKFNYNQLTNFTGSSTMYLIYATSTTNAEFIGNKVDGIKNSSTIYGIYASTAPGALFKNNSITNITNSSTTYCIYQTAGANAIFESNKLSSVNAGTGTLYGYYISAYSQTDYRLINNTISDLNTTGTLYGMYLYSGAGYKLYHNTIHLSGAKTTANISSCITFYSSTTSGYRVSVDSMYNNSFTNTIANSGTAYNYIFYGSSTLVPIATAWNYNNIYCTGVGNNVYSNWWNNATPQTTFADWQTASTFDTNSISVEPLFVSNSLAMPQHNLSAVPPIVSPLIGAGKALVNNPVPLDILNKTRNITTPTIGAYEDYTDITAPVIDYSNLGNTTFLTNRTVSIKITDDSGVLPTTANLPRLYYKKTTAKNDLASWQFVTATGVYPNYQFIIDYSKIGGVSINDRIQYFYTAQDVNANVAISHSLSTYYPVTSVALVANNFPIDGVLPEYGFAQGISGIKTVGLGGDFTSFSANDSTGVFNTLSRLVVNGDLTLKVISTITETGTTALAGISREGGNWKVTITPDGLSERVISGAYSTDAVLKFENVYGLTIDGSGNQSGVGRFLTFTNTATTITKTAGIRISGTAVANTGCKNIAIKNCNIIGLTNTAATSYGIIYWRK